MTDGKSKDILSVSIELELKQRLKDFAGKKHWSMSQAAKILIQEGLARAEAEETVTNGK